MGQCHKFHDKGLGYDILVGQLASLMDQGKIISHILPTKGRPSIV